MDYRRILITGLSALSAAGLMAQSAVDALNFSQYDMKGTARFMGMAGAFGALGGDLSSLSQNPAGIGVYRNNDIGFTLNLDCQRATSDASGRRLTTDQTKFLLNNIGGVFTMRLPSSVMPNFNIGFTYNKGASFNRDYAGGIGLRNSLSNYIAGIANAENITVGDVTTTDSFDPYRPTDGGYAAPWLAILGYDGFMITPQGDPDKPHWVGQWASGTSGNGYFHVREKGSVDEYNIALGGNISNVVFWGMNFDIINFNYTADTYWSESLDNADIPGDDNTLVNGTADTGLSNYYNANGSGFNYQLGIIVKPIQELRLGFAFHTPTWYSLTENFAGQLSYSYDGGATRDARTNNGKMAYNNMNFRSPWRVIASIAGVIGGRFILSADYEWQPYHAMRFSQPSNYGYDGWDDWGDWDYGWDDWGDPWYSKGKQPAPMAPSNDPYYDTNNGIKQYYCCQNTLRVGAEFRVTPQFSVRAGYSYVSSPVKSEAREGREIIYTSGTMPNYTFNKTTNYITGGLGYRYQKFYVDLAYVYKHLDADYHAYTSDPANPGIPSPTSALSLSNHQIVLSAGFRF